jgi:hypothetical protein
MGESRRAGDVQSWFNKRFGRNPDRYGLAYVHSVYDLLEPTAIWRI